MSENMHRLQMLDPEMYQLAISLDPYYDSYPGPTLADVILEFADHLFASGQADVEGHGCGCGC